MIVENLASRILASKSFKRNGIRPYLKALSEFKDQMQHIHTPFDLCNDVLTKVSERTNLNNSEILVLFNLEFVEVLISRFRVNPSCITFAADSEKKRLAAENWFKINACSVTYAKPEGIVFMPELKKRFDVIVMNPPYQRPTKNTGGGSGSRNILWDKFVDMSINLAKDGGHIANIHPSTWRKPLSALYPKLSKLQIDYLEMHSKRDGQKMFKVSTPYDWYVLHNVPRTGTTVVVDTDGNKHKFLMSDMRFLPNCNFEEVEKLIAKEGEEKCEVLFSYKEYETRKPWMKETEDSTFKHPCVHTTSKGETRFWYSRRRRAFFDVPKVIFGESDTIQNVIVDVDGHYGITQQAIGLPIESEHHGEMIKRAIESEKFNNLLQKSMRWSQFRIDWRLFTLFKKDFWKEFI